MKYSDLIKEYRQLLSLRVDDFVKYGLSEKTITIHETDQIRIILVRKPEEPQLIKMEIEITLPEQIWGLDANLTSNEFSSPDQPQLRVSLEEILMLFQYLLALQKAGFNLDFFDEEGIWVASCEIDEEPSKAFFTKFKPPNA